ncbi:IS1595 family transposase [Cribrihabitans marinus]|uniref:IS1595 family transposase n=1 Tax=Cribrihabitans marinus TaxID=1227549 RepID=UPI000B819BC5|nr:IS1595 family transposase [Cribrihabitans marinus]
MQTHDFRLFLDRFDDLNPAQIEDARTKIRDVRRKSDALTEIESRTKREHKCPHCGDDRRQKWGRTRTNVQRYRCGGCQKTYCGRTASRTGRIHRPDLFLDVIRDMLGPRVPSSVRQLANRLGLDKRTIWRWRMIILAGMKGSSSDAFAGIIEADEAFQRESRKGSREWVKHLRDPANHPRPPRLRWYEYGKKGVPMLRGLSHWHVPILTVADRGGAKMVRRIPDRTNATICRELDAMVPADAVLCTDAHQAYQHFAKGKGLEHFVVGGKGKAQATASHHIQNINSLHSRYSDFILLFRGPASKYLAGYLDWFVARQIGLTPAAVFRAA